MVDPMAFCEDEDPRRDVLLIDADPMAFWGWGRTVSGPTLGSRALLAGPKQYLVEAGVTPVYEVLPFSLPEIASEPAPETRDDVQLESALNHVSQILELLPGDPEADRRIDNWFNKLEGNIGRGTPLNRP